MRIAYVCEGGEKLGWGHVGRGRAVVEAAPSGSELLIGRGFGDISAWSKRNDVTLPLAPWNSPIAPVAPAAYDVIVVDHYTLPAEWVSAAARIRPTFLIDDWMRGEAIVTGLINPNVGARRDDYRTLKAREWLLGPDFALLRREVREITTRIIDAATPARHVLVTLGGSDPGGWTAQVSEEIVQLPWYEEGGTVTIVLGGSYMGLEPWTEWSPERRRRLEVVRQPRDFTQRCALADVVVSGAGTTTYELAYLGRCFVPIAIADNQARITREWYARGVGASVLVWDPSWRERLRDTVTELLTSPARRAQAAASASGLVDGRGVERLLAVCRSHA